MKLRLHIDRVVFDHAPWDGGGRAAFERRFTETLRCALAAQMAQAAPATRRTPLERLSFDSLDAADPGALAAALAAHLMGAA